MPKNNFEFLDINYNAKGSRAKRFVIDKKGKIAYFKYEGKNYNVSEACSEKMCYEIAKVLGYNCAKIELARDLEGNLGILNYLFFNIDSEEHIDAVSYLNINSTNRSVLYTISNIKYTLDSLELSLFPGFIKIMFFDALVGEQDRHEENWGIINKNGKYRISPLYDNGDNLLGKFKDEMYAEKYYSGIRDFDLYINKSRSMIYKDDSKEKYKHFDLIKDLAKSYPDIIKREIVNLKKLDDKKIKDIVNKIPSELLTDIHKEYIIKYLIKRRNILLNVM